MPEAPTHAEVEERFLALLADNRIPAPDDIAHLKRAVAFFWNDTKSIVVIDLDEVEYDAIADFDVDDLFSPPPWDDPLLDRCPETA